MLQKLADKPSGWGRLGIRASGMIRSVGLRSALGSRRDAYK